jgi:glycosyltransferase involved in cell wall biosynthesis
MTYFFSIIIPTRDRPEFIKESLKYISLQSYKNFEVIVSDNYSAVELSCETYFEQAEIPNSKYIRPLTTMGMVENWNFALSAATGDYLIYLTDKMFLLPNTLYNLNAALSENVVDLVSWVDNVFTPTNGSDYFGPGYYLQSSSRVETSNSYIEYSPLEELSTKGIATVSRELQDRTTYSRGKICFGAYSKELILRIINKYERLFYNICPDYTSMILALSEANSAMELKNPGIVHINTNISNGGLAALKDDFALGYLNSLKNPDDLVKSMLIKDLYSSQHNMVSHDYLYLKNKFKLSFQFTEVNWLKHIYEDLYLKPRNWSSINVEYTQKGFFINHIDSLPVKEKEILNREIEDIKARYREQGESESIDLNVDKNENFIKEAIKFIIPYGILNIYREMQQKKLAISDNLKNSLEDAVTITSNN